jgi:hypothetical protein
VNENMKLEEEIEKFGGFPLVNLTKLPEYDDLSLVVNFLGTLFYSNKVEKKLDEKVFQNSEILNFVYHRLQYKKWKRSEDKSFNFCDHPWILDVHFKTKILDEESKQEMKNELAKDFLNLK